MDMQDKIFDVVVPTEEEIEIKDGKRRTVERRVFPGYILVQMLMSEDSWYVVRNTPGVTGFVGMGNEPTPLRPDEVAKIMNRMEAEAPKGQIRFPDWRKSAYRHRPIRRLYRYSGRNRCGSRQGTGDGFLLWPGNTGRT